MAVRLYLKHFEVFERKANFLYHAQQTVWNRDPDVKHQTVELSSRIRAAEGAFHILKGSIQPDRSTSPV